MIMDGVFNHCGSFHKWMDKERIYENAEGYEKGAYISADSPYRNYFSFGNQNAWPYNRSYDGWWGHDTLPKLNYEDSKELVEYVLRMQICSPSDLREADHPCHQRSFQYGGLYNRNPGCHICDWKGIQRGD